MKIKVEHLGYIHKGEVNLDRNLTVFIGKNQTGKTYLNYLIYGFLTRPGFNFPSEWLKPYVDDLTKYYACQINVNDFFTDHKEELNKELSNWILNDLDVVFGMSRERFKDTIIDLGLDYSEGKLQQTWDTIKRHRFITNHRLFTLAQNNDHFGVFNITVQEKEQNRRVTQEIYAQFQAEEYVNRLLFMILRPDAYFAMAERSAFNLFHRNFNELSKQKDIIDSFIRFIRSENLWSDDELFAIIDILGFNRFIRSFVTENDIELTYEKHLDYMEIFTTLHQDYHLIFKSAYQIIQPLQTFYEQRIEDYTEVVSSDLPSSSRQREYREALKELRRKLTYFKINSIPKKINSFINDFLRNESSELSYLIIDYLEKMIPREDKGGGFKEIAAYLEHRIFQGKVEQDEFGNFAFHQTGADGNSVELPLVGSASLVKSLAFFADLIKNRLSPGNFLLIDEPEINLHPDNQYHLARVIAMLANAGVKVVVSTHSLTFLQELNNLMMLAQLYDDSPEKQKICKEAGYTAEMELSPNRVRAYLFDDNTIKELAVTTSGIQTQVLVKILAKLNEVSHDLYQALKNQPERDEDDE